MKKNLLTLALLPLVACALEATESTTYDLNFTNLASQSITSVRQYSPNLAYGTITVDPAPTPGAELPIELSEIYLQYSIAGKADIFGAYSGSSAYTKSMLMPWIDVSSRTWTLRISFEVTKNISLSDITIALFGGNQYSSSAQPISSEGATATCSMSLAQASTELASLTSTSVNIAVVSGGSSNTQASYTTDGITSGSGAFVTLSPAEGCTLDLVTGQTYTFSLTVGGNAAMPTAGLGGIMFTTASTAPVPEPATATLSLLALAGLCARRRRK